MSRPNVISLWLAYVILVGSVVFLGWSLEQKVDDITDVTCMSLETDLVRAEAALDESNTEAFIAFLERFEEVCADSIDMRTPGEKEADES